MITLKLVFLLVLFAGGPAISLRPSLFEKTIFNHVKQNNETFGNVEAIKKRKLLTRADNAYRLPNTTKPLHYDIWWKIDVTPPIQRFSGLVEIDLYATQPNVDKIVIHTFNLTIESVNLQLEDEIIYQTYSFDVDHDFLIINLNSGYLQYDADNPIYYSLKISFNAPLRTDMNGLNSNWFLNFGKINWMAVTQFQATYARSAFPCYDEPAYKATFDVTITRQENFKSWSNMKLKESRNSLDQGYVDDVFYTTPVMSTYLLAIIVAEYESLAKFNGEDISGGADFEVIARPDAIRTGQGDYIFNLGQKNLDELIDFTGIDYYSIEQFMKLTHAAIPAANIPAMENWGLNTYREGDLMYDEGSSNVYQKEYTSRTVTHESTHQWFGNLVTLDWWDATWLNEGFATYFEFYITDKLTDMGYATRFLSTAVQLGLLQDSFSDPQPLTNPDVDTPDSISDMFSAISYYKGASLIRMTDHLIGSETHKLGLRRYLNARAFQSARPIDLFENLEASALETGAISQYGPDFSIVDYYTTWTEQGGHPVLEVDVDRQNGLVHIRQRQFNMDNGTVTPKMNWIIPITFTTASNPDFSDTKPTYIIKDENTTLPITLGADEWIIFNIQQTGFYRVNYDEHSYNLLINILRGPERELIHEFNRAQIVDDALQFARAGLISYNRMFNIISFMRNETTYPPWIATQRGFNWILSRLLGTPLARSVKDLYLEWTTNVMNDLTYLPVDGEPFMRAYLRKVLAPVLCTYGSEECRSTAQRLFADLYNWGIEVPVDTRSWVYCTGLREGNSSYYNFLFNRYMYHPVNNEQLQILLLLGCTTDEASLFSWLDSIFKQKFVVRQQDLNDAYSSAVSNNEDNPLIVLKYMQNNLEYVRERFHTVTNPLFSIALGLRTESEIKEFEDWVTQNKDLLGDDYQDVFAYPETVKERLRYVALIHDDINSYLIKGDTNL
ncbi:hypothetical protein ACJJTC_018162 [Scirpophaga incertulas]